MDNEIAGLMADLEEEKVLALVKQRIDEGMDINEILADCQQGMIGVGRKFEEGTYFISDLMMAGEIFKLIGEMIGPNLGAAAGRSIGKVVVGTVKDDIHDIGKDLVAGMLKTANIEVIDLGVDVPAERFVEAVKESGAKVVSLSALLTIAFDSIKNTVQAFEDAGLRDQVKIMIGGGPIDETVCQYTGADSWGADAHVAVSLAKGWLS